MARPIASPAGVTLNDSGDGDAGANDLQNFPLITFAALHSGQTRVSCFNDTPPTETYTIRLYSSPALARSPARATTCSATRPNRITSIRRPAR
jgi:hypothetical protein